MRGGLTSALSRELQGYGQDQVKVSLLHEGGLVGDCSSHSRTCRNDPTVQGRRFRENETIWQAGPRPLLGRGSQDGV